jgi:hypothetical protein
MPRLAFVVVVLVAFTGCQKTNPDYCPSGATADGADCIDGGTGGPCKTRNDCTAEPGFPVCDTADNGGTCVQCTSDDHALCTGLTPRCDDRTCVACVDDNDCDTGAGVCLPTGGCADPSSIIHAVSSNGSTASDCGAAGNACTLDTALTLATSTKNVIKLDDAGPYTSAVDDFVVDTDPAIELTIDARGAALHRITDGAILTINSDKAVTILGGTIENATGSGGDGIRCNTNATLTMDGTTIAMNDESAIDASSCTLTVRNATIRGNSKPGGSTLFPGIQAMGGSSTISRSSITDNLGGGIVIANGKFEIVGNVFLSNGDIAGTVGGVSVSSTVSMNRLELNTITQNKSNDLYAAGVQCMAPASSTAQNNIIWNNNSAFGLTGIQVSGGCLHAYSDIGPATLPAANDGSYSVNVDPSFVNELTDLHLQPGTMVRGKANPGTDLTGIASKDMDGKTRIQPADLGAYVAPLL